MSVTACARPGCLRPITLIGKSQGNASGELAASTGKSPRASGGNALSPARAHHLALKVLVELVHPAEYRTGAAVADRAAVELDHRQHFLRRRRHPNLVGGAHLGLGDRAQLEREAMAARELDDDVVGDAGKDQFVFRRRLDYAALDNEDVGGRCLGELAVAEKNRLNGVGLRRELAQQDVADQRDRFDVTAKPPVVARRDGGRAALHLRARRRHERVRHHEHRRLRILRKSVVALGDAARDLEVHALVFKRLARDQAADERSPLLARVGVADADRAKAALQPVEMLFEPEGHLGVHRHHFIDAVAEDETAVEHRHLGLGKRHEAAVQENYLIHSLSVSHARPKMPAGPTASSATTGYSANGLPSSVTRSVPTRCSAATGATSGCCDTSSALSFAASPLGTVTKRSRRRPAFTSRAAPFQTSSARTGSPAP